MKLHLKNLVFALLVLGSAMSPAAFAQGAASTGVIFENVRIFDGTVDRLSGPSNVLTVGNVIKAISGAPIPDPPGVTVTRIQGGGRTLMPGLIDNHWHTMFASPSMAELIAGDLGYLTLLAVPQAEATLMRGFTTVRDLGGPSFALKRAIDEGLVVGPRIYPSGAMITITGGHGDFRSAHELPRRLGGPLTIAEAAQRQPARRFAGRGAHAHSRAVAAGCLADQADRRRRCGLAAQPAGRVHLHRRRVAGRSAGRRQLGHLRRCPRLHVRRRSSARSQPA